MFAQTLASPPQMSLAVVVPQMSFSEGNHFLSLRLYRSGWIYKVLWSKELCGKNLVFLLMPHLSIAYEFCYVSVLAQRGKSLQRSLLGKESVP